MTERLKCELHLSPDVLTGLVASCGLGGGLSGHSPFPF